MRRQIDLSRHNRTVDKTIAITFTMATSHGPPYRWPCMETWSKTVANKIPNVNAEENGTGPRSNSQTLPGMVSAFLFHANGSAAELSVDRPIPKHKDGWLWLHFDLADPRSSKSVQSMSGLPGPAKNLLVAANQQQQLYADNTCTYGVFVDFFSSSEEAVAEISFVAFAMTERLFISSCRGSFYAMNSFRDAIRGGMKLSGVAALVETIFVNVIKSVDGYARTLAENLDDIEEKILLDDLDDQRQMLGQIRRAAIRLSRQTAVSLSLIHRFEQENERRANSPLRFSTAMLGQRLDWLNTEIAAIRDRAHLLQEEAMLKTADQTNRNLQVLSIVSTIFLPASLIAGIFGMNVKGLPLTQNSNGFFWSMTILIGAAALIFWLLKRSGILS